MKLLGRAFRRLSIRWKVVSIMLGITAISLALAGAGLLWNTRLTFERQTQQRLTLLADVIGLNSTAALAFNDARAAGETLAALRSDAHVMAGGLYDARGRLFARYRRSDVDVTLPASPPSAKDASVERGHAAISRTIYLKGQPVGTVYLSADTGEWMDTLWGFIGILATLFAAVLAVGLLVAIWLQRIVTEPIAELAELTRRVGHERDYSLRAGKHGDDELGVLADGLNDMLTEVGRRRAELLQTQEELKQRVAELDAEVAERRRAEAQLSYSREQLANFVENANVGMHWVGPDGTILWANRYELEMLGYAAEDYIGRSIAEFHHEREVIDDILKRLTGGETIENYEAKLRHQDGTIRDVLINSSGYFEAGKFIHTRCFTRDVTERKRTEDALRQSEERYRTLVAATTSVVYTTDARGNTVERQPSWEAYTGQPWDSYADFGGLTMVHTEDRARYEREWNAAIANDAVFEIEARLWHSRSQAHRYCATRAIPLRDTNGSVREWIGTMTDIDDRKRAEEQFRLAVEAAPNAMVMVDQSGRIVLANRQLETLFGYGRAEMLGKSVELLVPERLQRAQPTFWSDFFADPHARPMGGEPELYGRHKDGRQIPVEIGLNPFTTADGVFCLASIIDVAERKRAEQDLRRYTEELERSNRELAQFAYVASHDLQEPLRAISGCVQLLQQRYDQKLDARADELIQHAVHGAMRMQALINDLLSYSRVGTRGKPFESCDMAQPLQEALANLSLAVNEAEAKVTWEELPAVSGDPTQITQVFQNLIGNALKFRGDRPPHIHVTARSRAGGHVISVSDNGIGIEPQYFERIFGVFQRLHSRNKYPGNGIGLAICRKIIERHGGRIWVESVPGQGSTFYFTIPTGGVQNEQPERYGQQN
jgi:PAS domain S-box-containing protein